VVRPNDFMSNKEEKYLYMSDENDNTLIHPKYEVIVYREGIQLPLFWCHIRCL
jgi:hypothetical protein